MLLKPLCKCLMNLWVFIHSVIDCIIDLCFSFYYNDSKRTQIPTVKESLLMESAVSLAERIRNKEVISYDMSITIFFIMNEEFYSAI